MKEATGDLSMTAVAVVAIAAIGVVFSTLIWPQIRTNILRSTYCSQAFNCDCAEGNTCTCNYCTGDVGAGEDCTNTVTCNKNDANL